MRHHQVDVLIAHKDSDVIALDGCPHTPQRTADTHTQVEGDLTLITTAGQTRLQVCEDSAHTLQGVVCARTRVCVCVCS